MYTLENNKLTLSARKYWLNVILVLILIVIEPQTYISYYKLSHFQVIIIELIIVGILFFKKKTEI